MKSDPVALHFFVALVSAALGFMFCAVLASRRIRRANIEGYKEAVRHLGTHTR